MFNIKPYIPPTMEQLENVKLFVSYLQKSDPSEPNFVEQSSGEIVNAFLEIKRYYYEIFFLKKKIFFY